ncbi:MAG: proline dehydrogenase family protein [Rhodothermales bacterium]|nr:proline dehydrogenase family protein [Rhodothermales bacterium]MBO6779132.1 proline dehydrogenase family protein [Rhodothermales bacterium]
MKLPFFLARRFVAAETLEDTLPVAQSLRDQGLYTTLDLLGEYISKRKLAEEARDQYLRLLHALGKQDGIDRNISIKLSMLGQKIDEEFCVANLRRLLDVAKASGTFVRLDMEGSDVTESTVGILERVHPEYPDNVGIVLQAYLKRTGEDVARMCELGARVRLCKGAYKEPAEIAYQDMDTIRTRYLEHMEVLMQRGRYPAIATHDDILIAAVKSYVEANSVSRDDFEFQMLYGIRNDTQLQTVAEGYNMRVYIPYGTKWVPYFSRRLRERKENVWFVLKHLFTR